MSESISSKSCRAQSRLHTRYRRRNTSWDGTHHRSLNLSRPCRRRGWFGLPTLPWRTFSLPTIADSLHRHNVNPRVSPGVQHSNYHCQRPRQSNRPSTNRTLLHQPTTFVDVLSRACCHSARTAQIRTSARYVPHTQF